MVLGAVMTALVVLLQLLSTYTTFFGPFSTALALVPIIIGAALCGVEFLRSLGCVGAFVRTIFPDAPQTLFEARLLPCVR